MRNSSNAVREWEATVQSNIHLQQRLAREVIVRTYEELRQWRANQSGLRWLSGDGNSVGSVRRDLMDGALLRLAESAQNDEIRPAPRGHGIKKSARGSFQWAQVCLADRFLLSAHRTRAPSVLPRARRSAENYLKSNYDLFESDVEPEYIYATLTFGGRGTDGLPLFARLGILSPIGWVDGSVVDLTWALRSDAIARFESATPTTPAPKSELKIKSPGTIRDAKKRMQEAAQADIGDVAGEIAEV